MTPLAKLTLRDLFALVTIAAILVAWWVDRSRLARIHSVTREELRILQYRVYVQQAVADAAGGAPAYPMPSFREQPDHDSAAPPSDDN